MPLKIEENIPLAPFTTFGIGGPARYFAEVKSEKDAEAAIKFAHDKKLPIFILAGGSNILVNDDGFPGLVIRNQIKKFEINRGGTEAIVRVGSGENWDETVERCVKENLAGIECLSGIPGSVGAAPVQNIGAYGQNFSDVAVEVKTIDLTNGKLEVFNEGKCCFEYRKSIFNTKALGRYFITEVAMELKAHGAPALRYHDLKKYFLGKNPTLAEIRKAVIEIRAKKGMVILPDYQGFKSVGSFFKNPMVSRDIFNELQNRLPGSGWCSVPWFWKQNDGRIKISAACLIEQAGFKKGFKKGNVGISPAHTLALINFDGAKATDLLALAKEIQESVKEKFGIKIEPEAQLIGFSHNPLT